MMKSLFAIILLLPLFSFSQDCNFKKDKDPHTREIKISSGFIDLSATKVSVVATKTEIDFLFSLGSGNCFDDESTANVFYAGTKVKTNFKNTGTMNCDGLFHFTFRNQANLPMLLQNFVNKQVTSIKFIDNTKKEIVLSLTEEQQVIFKKLANCIVNEAKTLLQ